jgi:RNA polymerase sigma factor (sigma-70 family)
MRTSPSRRTTRPAPRGKRRLGAEATSRYDRVTRQPPPREPAATKLNLESTIELLERAKNGEAEATNQLLTRYLVPLRRWAHGRLPHWARDMSDTQDLVQDAVLQTLRHLQGFQQTRDGGLYAYLRVAVMNRIHDELRRVPRRPIRTEFDDKIPAGGASPFAIASANEALERYEAALAELREEEREIIIARMDFGLSYEQIAVDVGRPSADAVRVALRRALLKIAEIMKRGT